MPSVVNEVEHEVIFHCDVKSLHLIRLLSTSVHSAVYSVLSSHELFILRLDFINDVRCVDVITVLIPINILNYLFSTKVDLITFGAALLVFLL